MRRRYIALQRIQDQWQYAVASGDQQKATLHQVGSFQQQSGKTLAEQLINEIGPLQIVDRLAYALPAQSAMFRWLNFPFSDVHKIAVTAPPEMSRQIPCSPEGQAFFQQLLGANRALSVAVDKSKLEKLIENFDDDSCPLGYIGLTPFCYAAGLDWSEDGLLLSAEQNEIILGRCQNSQILDLRVLPQTATEDHKEIVQQAMLLARGTQPPLLHVRLLGLASDSFLAQTLRQSGFTIDVVQLKSEAGMVTDRLTSTACLALAATKHEKNSLNLRSGSYKLKNDWQAMKRRMWIAASLVLMILGTIGATGYIQYSQKSSQLKQIKLQIAETYQHEFPGEKLMVPAPLQLESKIKDLQKKITQFDAGAPSALKLLLSLSNKITPELSVDIKEYLHSEKSIRLSGTTTNFDTVSKLLSGLQREPQFKSVRILDSKQALDGKQVDFRLQIELGDK
jgi:Fimbrial assembly protein (PilN)